jgi:hypothetical protein
MSFQQTLMERIDSEDETFRISENLDPASILESLRSIGQLNPVVLLETGPRAIIVCGFRRVRALRLLGAGRVLARVLPENSLVATKIYDIAIWDNLSHRQLNPLEQGRVILKLKRDFGVEDSVLIRSYLPIMGLAPHPGVLQTCLLLNQLRPGIRECLNGNKLTLASAAMIAGMTAEDQDCIASLMDRIRLSASFQKKLFSLLRELAIIESKSPGNLLTEERILAVLENEKLSPFQKGEKLHDLFYRARNPRLSQVLETFQKRKESLGLPGSIRISADPYFETPGIRVDFDARSAEKFRDSAAALHKAAQDPALERLFQSSENSIEK